MKPKPHKDGRIWKKEDLLTTQHHHMPQKGYLFTLYDVSCLDGPIEKTIKLLQKVRLFYKNKGFEGIEVDIDTYYHGGETEISLSGYRIETYEERNKRIQTSKNKKVAAKKREAKKKLTREVKDKAEYDRLKKKFGKGKK